MWIAGYTTRSWSPRGLVAGLGMVKNDCKAFLLNVNTMKRIPVSLSTYAISCGADCGPMFGPGQFGVRETVNGGKMETISDVTVPAAYCIRNIDGVN